MHFVIIFTREIAHVIREADYFQVFNDLLIDSISRIGKELCGKNKQTHTSQSGEDDYSFTGLLKDLKRMCCSSEYMFFYAQELVTATGKALNKKRKVCDVGEEGEETDNKADSAVLLNGQGIDMHYQWSKKMRRLCQELNETAVWPDSAETMPQPLSRSKSFTLKLTELYSSQLIADELSLDREVWGLRLHQIFKIIPAVLDDDDIPEPKIGELCEILFGCVEIFL